MLISTWEPLVVLVRAYHRVRFGRLESVRSHHRSYPNQLRLFT